MTQYKKYVERGGGGGREGGEEGVGHRERGTVTGVGGVGGAKHLRITRGRD